MTEKIKQKTIKSVELNGKRIRFRKWKGKDKKSFIQQIKEYGLDNVSLEKTMDILVHRQLESNKEDIFSQDEYRYLLQKIRQYSLGEDMSTELYCEECQSPFTHEYKISDVIRPLHESLEDYDDGEVFIKFGGIKNKKLYLEAVQENKELEIFYRIDEFNGSKAHSVESLMEEFEDLDLDQIENIVNYFEENKFSIDDIQEVECPHCQHKTPYEFDEIPDFFPQSWFEEAFKDVMEKIKEEQTKEEIRSIFGMNEEESE